MLTAEIARVDDKVLTWLRICDLSALHEGSCMQLLRNAHFLTCIFSYIGPIIMNDQQFLMQTLYAQGCEESIECAHVRSNMSLGLVSGTSLLES